jgi:hypothetical protein
LTKVSQIVKNSEELSTGCKKEVRKERAA